MTIQKAIEVLENVISFDYTEETEAIGVVLKALAELKESKKEGKWKPEYNRVYWYRKTGGEMCSSCYTNNYDEWRINNMPVFPTKEECARYWHFMDTVKEKSYDFSKESWENGGPNKYIIAFDYKENKFYVTCFNITKFLGTTYFKTEDDAKYIIDNFKDELMEYWI